MRAVVFDTGEHGVGGRAATRCGDDGSLAKGLSSPPLSALAPLQQQKLVFDHAAQCFSTSDAAFRQQVDAWEAAGVVSRWRGPVGTLAAGAGFQPLGPDASPLYAAAGGMRRLAEHMATEVQCSCVALVQAFCVQQAPLPAAAAAAAFVALTACCGCCMRCAGCDALVRCGGAGAANVGVTHVGVAGGRRLAADGRQQGPRHVWSCGHCTQWQVC